MVNPEVFPEKKEIPFKEQRVGYDLDDLFFDLAEPSLEDLNKRYGTNFKKDEIEDYYYIRALLKKIGIPEEEILSFREELYLPPNKHQVYERSPVIPGAVEVVNGVCRIGHQPFAVTSRPPGLEKTTEEQLRAAGIVWIKGDWAEGGNILIRDKYYWEKMSSAEFKLRVIKGDFHDVGGKYKDFPGLDAHFDDMGALIHHDLAAGIENRIFIIYRNYNKNVPKTNLIKNWWVFYKVVRCLERDEDLDWLTSHNVDIPPLLV